MIEDKRKQVSDQCRVVEHLAKSLADAYRDYANVFKRGGPQDEILDLVGERTASFMEQLGDMLDAREEDDEWTDPIFEEAQRLWPRKSPRP